MDLFQRPHIPSDDTSHKRRRTSAADTRAEFHNSGSFTAMLRQWLLTSPSTFTKYVKEWTVCPTHDCITETPRPWLRARDDCEFCWRNSDVKRCIEASSDCTKARDAWRALRVRKRDVEEEDFWRAQDNQPRSLNDTRMTALEKDEAGLWLSYTLAAWDISVERRRLTADASNGNTSMMPPHPNDLLGDYILDQQERTADISLTTDKTLEAKMYCFEHDAVGDLMMHRHPKSYKECGVCLTYDNSKTAQQDTQPTVTTASSWASSSSSSVSNSMSISVPKRRAADEDDGLSYQSRGGNDKLLLTSAMEAASSGQLNMDAVFAPLEQEIKQRKF